MGDTPMGFLDQFGTLVASIVAVVIMLVLAIISFFITIFIVKTGAEVAGYSAGSDSFGTFVTLSAAIITAGAISAGASPLTAIAGTEE